MSNLDEAATDLELTRLLASAHDAARRERGDDGGMPLQHLEAPLLAWNGEAVHLPLEKRLLRADDGDMQALGRELPSTPQNCRRVSLLPLPCYFALSRSLRPFSIASSIVPTLRNACSGR